MSLQYITQSDFSGGINATDDPTMIGGNEVLDAEDCFVDSKGLVRRRGPIVWNAKTINNSDLGIDWGAPVVIAAGRHDYGAHQGVFCVSRQAYAGADWLTLWFIPYYGSTAGTPKSIMSALASSSRAGMAAVCPAITKASSESAVANAKYNRTLISCEAFTVVVMVNKGAAFSNTTFPPNDYTKNISFGDATTSPSTTWGMRVTLIAANISDGQTLSIAGQQIKPKLYEKSFRTATTVGGYSFLAGDATMVQHFYWSAAEDSTTWSDNDFEYAPDLTSSPVRALVNLNDSLCILKERSISMLKVGNSGPTGWTLAQRSASTGTCDQRSVARWQDSIVFADQRGIYMFDGYDVVSISDKISGLWRPVFTSAAADDWSSTTEYAIGDTVRYASKLYVATQTNTGNPPNFVGSVFWSETQSTYTQNWSVVGFTFGEYYTVAVTDANGYFRIGFIVHLPTRAWTRINGARITAATAVPDSNVTVTGFYYPTSVSGTYGAQYVTLSTILDGCTGQDFNANGLATNSPLLSITTARLSAGDHFRNKVWRRIEVSQKSTGSQGALQVQYLTGTDPANNTFTSVGTLTKGLDTKQRFRISARSRAVCVRIREIVSGGGILSNATISGIRIGLKPMRESRDEGN